MNTAKIKLDRSRGTLGIAYPLRAPGFTPGFWSGRCCSSFFFSFLCCVFVLFVFFLCLVHKCCQCLWIVHSSLPFQFSLTFIIFIRSIG